MQQEALRRLHSIREDEKELNSWFQALSAAKHPKTPPPTHMEERGPNNIKQWKLAKARICRDRDFPKV